jgi:site-specific recombinase XerD
MPHDLIPASALPPGTLTDVEIADAIGFAGAEKAQATRAAYAVDWRQFSLWCHARAAQPLPAHPGILAGYLSHLARTGRKASSIGRAVAAIADHHRQAGYEPPTKHEGVRAVMKGIRRTLGTAPERKAAATAEHVRGMLACCPDSLIGLRDRALLALGFAGAFRRSELAALEVSDLAEVPDGYRVTIRRSKTDQTGEGQEIVIPRGAKIRPVEAVQAWLQAANITVGFLFRPVLKGGRVGEGCLLGADVARLVKRYAEKTGLDPAQFAGHSLRAGFVTSAAEAGASILKIQEVSRHRSVDVLSGYVRRVDMFRDHAGAGFL